jgi:hypothetical protein
MVGLGGVGCACLRTSTCLSFQRRRRKNPTFRGRFPRAFLGPRRRVTGLCTADGGFADVVVGRSRAGGAREKGRENPRCATCADQRRAFHHRRVDVRDNRVEVRVLFGASRKPCKAGLRRALTGGMVQPRRSRVALDRVAPALAAAFNTDPDPGPATDRSSSSIAARCRHGRPGARRSSPAVFAASAPAGMAAWRPPRRSRPAAPRA